MVVYCLRKDKRPPFDIVEYFLYRNSLKMRPLFYIYVYENPIGGRLPYAYLIVALIVIDIYKLIIM